MEHLKVKPRRLEFIPVELTDVGAMREAIAEFLTEEDFFCGKLMK